MKNLAIFLAIVVVIVLISESSFGKANALFGSKEEQNKDPCAHYTCGKKAECKVVKDVTTCKCVQCFEGDPGKECKPIKPLQYLVCVIRRDLFSK